MDFLTFLGGFVGGSLVMGSFGFWLGVRFGVLIVAEKYKHEIQAAYPLSVLQSKKK